MTAPGELARRWAVALVGVPVVVVLLYYGGWLLGVPLALLAALGALELRRLATHLGTRAFWGLGAAGAAALVLAAAWRPTFTDFAPLALSAVGAVLLSSVCLAVFVRGPEGQPLEAAAITLFGSTYAGLPLAMVPLLHALPTARAWGAPVPGPWVGLAVVALPLAATWIGDAAAFFAGTRWGKSKIAPTISPNKSWVGSWSGLAGAASAGCLWYVLASPQLPGVPIGSIWAAGAVGAVLGAGAQVGDLVVSVFKREAGVKDTGTIFPGHGGVLDRLDALAVTLPVAFALLVMMERLA